jgi:3-hydroxyacyl-[acyl-carrier-protein] dehydratase
MRFLLVDRILELEPGRSIRAEKTLPASEELFRDHFPGFPVVPGVLLTEMMAQAAGKCLNAQRLPRGVAMLIEIRNARFRTWAQPDQLIGLAATIERNLDEVATARCEASVNGRRICSAELLFAFKPLETFAPDYRDEVLETFLASLASAAG